MPAPATSPVPRRRPRQRSRAAAFTLLELLVATTVAIIVVAAASSTIFLILRSVARSGQASTADGEAQLVAEFLTAQLQGIGGGAVRPWMAFALENNDGVDGSDIVHFADVPADVPGSATVIEHLGSGRFSFFLVNDGVGRCALADLRRDLNGDGFAEPVADARAAFTADDLVGHQVILTSPTGESWRSVVIEDAGLGRDRLSCFASFRTEASGLAATGALRGADNVDRGLDGVERLDQWVFGQMTFVRSHTWLARPAPGGVPGEKVVVERLAIRGEPIERTIFEGVRDLQVAAGYDHAPSDGVLRESSDGADDEWLGNASGEANTLPADLITRADPIPADALRMLRVQVVTALPRGEATTTVRALDGPVVRAPEARVSTGQAYLRNLLLFL